MRKKILLGNWKMNKTSAEAKAFAIASMELTTLAAEHNVVLGVAPSFLVLSIVNKINPNLVVASQNVHFEDKGAFTGEISVQMLKDINISWSLIGHSERRTYFKEDNISCNKKVKKLLNERMIPVLCVGETLVEYELGHTKAVVGEQIRVGLSGIPLSQGADIVIAYEPVWSIGTGKNASSEIAEDICGYIRGLLDEIFSQEISNKIHILYGGSVKPVNVKEYLSMPNIDGALVGGASLEIESFSQLLQNII